MEVEREGKGRNRDGYKEIKVERECRECVGEYNCWHPCIIKYGSTFI